MKKVSLFILSFCLALMMQAAVSKTVNLTTAGTLNTVLTADELTTITDLTLSGNIDARDFKTMRDAMTVLANIDMSAAKVVAYKGTGGTYVYWTDVYNENVLPLYSFFDRVYGKSKTTLKSIKLPSSIISIGDYAFGNCSGLTSISIPNSVISIGLLTFDGCSDLTIISVDDANTAYSSIDGALYNKTRTVLIDYLASKKGSFTIPSSVISIGNYAFHNCPALTSVIIPSSVTSIGDYAFYSSQALASINIPSSVTSIGKYALWFCSGLTSISIPSSVTSIGNYAFQNCRGLTSIRVMSPTPVALASSYVFDGVSKTIPLYVPVGSKAAYAAADYWKEFTNIIEFSCLLSTPITLANEANSTQTLNVTANTSWTASSTASWLDVSPPTATVGNGTITLTAKSANTGAARTASLSLTAAGVPTQTITITQAAGASVALSSADANEIAISPNPTTAYFTVNTSTTATVEVYTQAGALLISTTATSKDQIMLDAFAAGAYIVKVTTSAGVAEHTLIKQ